MIGAMFGFFALPWVPWALSAALVLGALAVWVHFRWRLRAVVRGLDDALQVIQATSGAAAFRERFASVHQALSANRIVGEGWRAFAQTLVPVPGRDDAMGATRRPAEDLNESLLVHAGVNLRFYTAVPNYLVGLGLLFTFLGLVAALYFASAGVAAADVQAAQGALRDLLAAATFKFVTSIAGLGASIVYSSREKTHLYRAGRRLALLCTALEQRLVPVTPEYLGTVQLGEMKTQSALLRRLGRHLHVTIPETVEERLAEELIEAVQPMREGFAQAAARLAELDDRMIERLGQALAPAARAAPLEAAAVPGLDPALLAGLLEELRALRVTLETLPDGLGARAGAAPLAAALPGLVELLETSGAGLGTLERRLELAQRRLRAAVGGLAAARSGAAADELAASLDGLAGARRDLDRLGRAFRQVAQGSRDLLQRGIAAGRTRDPELDAALDEVARSVQGFNEQVRGFVGRMDEELARSSHLLGGVVGSLDQEPPR